MEGCNVPGLLAGPDGVVLEPAAERQADSFTDRIHCQRAGIHSPARCSFSQPQRLHHWWRCRPRS